MDCITDGPEGFVPGDSTLRLDFEKAVNSVRILARFHAKYWGAKDPCLKNIARFSDMESGLTCKFLVGNADFMLQVGFEQSKS